MTIQRVFSAMDRFVSLAFIQQREKRMKEADRELIVFLERSVAKKDAALLAIKNIYENREMSTLQVAYEMCRVACEALKDSQ